MLIPHGGRVEIILAPAVAGVSSKSGLGADFIRRGLEAVDSSVRVEVEAGNASQPTGAHIYLWDYSVAHPPGAGLELSGSRGSH